MYERREGFKKSKKLKKSVQTKQRFFEKQDLLETNMLQDCNKEVFQKFSFLFKCNKEDKKLYCKIVAKKLQKICKKSAK